MVTALEINPTDLESPWKKEAIIFLIQGRTGKARKMAWILMCFDKLKFPMLQ